MGRLSTYDDVRAVCPYYKGATETDVRCEGFEKGSCIIMRFAGRHVRDAYRARYCDSMERYGDCPVKRAHEPPGR